MDPMSTMGLVSGVPAPAVDVPVGPPPRLIRFYFTDIMLASKFPKGLAVPLGINRVHVATTLRSLCNGNAAGTCYGNAAEAAKSDVLGVDLEAILEYVEEDTWAGKKGPGGGKMLREHGFLTSDGELHVVFQHYSPAPAETNMMQQQHHQQSPAPMAEPQQGGKGTGKRRKNETEDPPFSSIEVVPSLATGFGDRRPTYQDRRQWPSPGAGMLSQVLHDEFLQASQGEQARPPPELLKDQIFLWYKGLYGGRLAPGAPAQEATSKRECARACQAGSSDLARGLWSSFCREEDPANDGA
eukprot:scaffold305517_cov47-Prasinocladus_malaysianus.AAC.1